MITLITGGVKSGKSRRALEIAIGWQQRVSFVATAAELDDEMRDKIARHKAERAALGWDTIEEQLELGRAAREAGDALVVDCVPMWVNNLLHYGREADFEPVLADFLRVLAEKRFGLVVTNETGLGTIPADAPTRRYNLLLAEANKRIAALAGSLELMVCGIPLAVK